MNMEHFARLVADHIAKEDLELGMFTLCVAGKTGVGKSTLINALFGEEACPTGMGKPVTMQTTLVEHPSLPLAIYDTRGLELADYKKTVAAVEEIIRSSNKGNDLTKHVHVGLICIAEDSRRIEAGELELAAAMAKHVPVLGVITKSRSDQGFAEVVRQELQEATGKDTEVVRVRALAEELDGGLTLAPMGLEPLCNAIGEAIPPEVLKAFAMSQQVSLELKRTAAQRLVKWYAATSFAAGGVPIPALDIIALTATLGAMFAKVGSIYGVSVGTTRLASLLTPILVEVGSKQLQKVLVGQVMKLFPGLGTAAGAAINGAIAGAMAFGLGRLYVSILHARRSEAPEEAIDVDAVFKDLAKQVRSGKMAKVLKEEEAKDGPILPPPPPQAKSPKP